MSQTVRDTATSAPPTGVEAAHDGGFTARFWASLLGTALALRLLFSLALVAGWPLVSDGSAYSAQATAFMRDFPGSDPYYWPPGTSYVLAGAYELFGTGRGVARLAMIAISLASIVATVLLARRVLRDAALARGAGWVLALVPSAVFMPSQPFSFDVTMLGLALTVLGVLAAWDRGQARWLAAAGLALGCAATARPGVLSILVVLAPAGVVAGRRAWRAGDRARARGLAVGAVAFVLLAVAPLLPALVHNSDVGAGVTVSTNNEGNLLLGNNRYTRDYATGYQGQHPFREFPPPERAYLAEHFTIGASPERRAEMRDDALDYMTAHPATTAWRTLNRARAFWGFDYTYSNGLRTDSNAPRPAVAGAALLEVGGWLVFGALALAGIVLGRRLFVPGRALFLLLIVAAYELPHIVAFSAGRWHLPVLALLAPFAAAGTAVLGSPREAAPRVLRSRPLLAALVLFAAVQVEYTYFVLTEA